MSLSDALRARIDADMRRVLEMDFRQTVGFLASYTGTLSAEMLREGATVQEVRNYADAALERARATESR